MTTIAADQPELLADLGEDEVVERVRHEDAGSPPRPVPKSPPTPSASRPWTVWKPSPSGSSHGIVPDPDPRPSGSRWRPTAIAAGRAAADHRREMAGGSRPATKNIVNAVSAMTPSCPRSGSLKTSTMTGATMIRNGTVPPQKPRTPRAALGEPVGQIDDQGELGDLGRVDRRQRPELEPARGAADDDVEAAARRPGRAATIGDDVERHRHEAQVAVVDPHHHQHRDEAEDRPLDLRPDGRERVGVLRQVALERGRRVDHQDADRRSGRRPTTRIT